MLHVKETARAQGYVTTLLGRRREIPELRCHEPQPRGGRRADGDQHADPGHGRRHHEDRDDPGRGAPARRGLPGATPAPGPRRAAPRGSARRGGPPRARRSRDDGGRPDPGRPAHGRREGRRRLGVNDAVATPPRRGEHVRRARAARGRDRCPRPARVDRRRHDHGRPRRLAAHDRVAPDGRRVRRRRGGRRVEAVGRRAKLVVVELSGGPGPGGAGRTHDPPEDDRPALRGAGQSRGRSAHPPAPGARRRPRAALPRHPQVRSRGLLADRSGHRGRARRRGWRGASSPASARSHSTTPSRSGRSGAGSAGGGVASSRCSWTRASSPASATSTPTRRSGGRASIRFAAQ